jgi:hypothetical protein
VLPPVSFKDLDDLRNATRIRRSDLELVTAESVAGGCVVVALDFYQVENREDLEPPYYRPRLRPVAVA